MIKSIINREEFNIELPKGTVLLDYLRDNLKLKGTKEGCREGDCGSCMVLLGHIKDAKLEYQSVNSCMFPLGQIEASHIVTIEGLNGNNINTIQKLFIEENASQCGYCTPGFIISLTGFLLNAKSLDENEAIASLSGNICRCTGYMSIIRAVKKICSLIDPNEFAESYNFDRIQFLVKHNLLPEYFLSIQDKLNNFINPNEVFNLSTKIIMGGGTDLYVRSEDTVTESDIIFTNNIKGLNNIYLEGNYCIVGSAVTVTELAESELICKILPDLKKHLKLISCTSIRNRATVGGNIVNASPIGDLSIIFLALNAELEITNQQVQRTVKLKDFFIDYKKLDLAQGELLTAIRFPIPSESCLFNFEKVSRRTHLDIASVNTAISIAIDNKNIIKEINLSAGGVSPIPLYLNEANSFLKNKELNLANIKEALEIALTEIKPISDVRGSIEYKTILFCQLLLSHFFTLFPDLD